MIRFITLCVHRAGEVDLVLGKRTCVVARDCNERPQQLTSSSSSIIVHRTIKNKKSVALIAYNGILLLLCAILAFKTRNIFSIFRESIWIAMVCFSVGFCSIVAIFILFAFEGSLGQSFYVKVVALGVSLFVTWLALLGRLIPSLNTKLASTISERHKMSSFGQTSSNMAAVVNAGQAAAKAYPHNTTTAAAATMSASIVKDVVTKEIGSLAASWRRSRLTILPRNFLIVFHLVQRSQVTERMPTPQGKCWNLRLVYADDQGCKGETFRLSTPTVSYLVQCRDSNEKKYLLSLIPCNKNGEDARGEGGGGGGREDDDFSVVSERRDG